MAQRMPVRAWAPLGLFAGAAILRLALPGGPLFGDEAVHYAVARGWGTDPGNAQPPYALSGALWWQRPLFSLLLAPGAALGLAGYRVEHALVSALLPVLVLAVARNAGVREWLAVAAAAATALHPALVLWGGRVVPDTPMAVLLLAGALAHQARRPLAAAALLLAAAWTKETALLALAGLLAWSLRQGRARGEVRWWPLELDRPATALLGAALLAPLPAAYSVLALGGHLPSWHPPLQASALPGFLATPWLLVPLLAGLASRRSRPWSLLALAYVALAGAYAQAGLGAEPSSVVLPIALGLLASAVAVDAALRSRRPASRAAARGATGALAVCLLLVALAPAGLAAAVAAPGGPRPAPPLPELAALLREDPLAPAIAAIGPDEWDVVLLVDPEWYHVHRPFAVRAGTLGWAYTTVGLPPADWAHAVEGSDVTVLQKVDRPTSHALRAAYADCVRFEDGRYAVIAGADCPGRTGRLHDEFAARQ